MVAWVASSDGTVVENAVVGGQDPDGETYYIGRVNVDGRIIVGKIHPSHHVCYIASMLSYYPNSLTKVYYEKISLF